MTTSPAMSSRVPHSCLWEITSACNLRCIHCFHSAGTAKDDELSTEEALSLSDSLAAAGCRVVGLTGGEPLFREDWPIISRRLADNNIEVVIATNGLLVDENTIARMIESGVDAVSISLDGNREVHDAIRTPAVSSPLSRYDAAVRALKLTTASALKTGVTTQVHKQNIDDLDFIYDLVASLGVDVWQIQIAIPLGRLLEIKHEYLIEPHQISALEKQIAGFIEDGQVPINTADNIGYYGRLEPIIRKSRSGAPSFWSGCRAGISSVAITPSGGIKGCHAMPDDFVTGNVRERSFVDIWTDSQSFPYNTKWDEMLLEGGCAECSYHRVCRAGCTSMAFAMTATVCDNPYCVQQAQEPEVLS
ncbi:MAG: radical SAM protein [Deltaproteobacteria bacterium]|nr:radical SAM protein [Deltaproteobacteria bacterium]